MQNALIIQIALNVVMLQEQKKNNVINSVIGVPVKI